MKTSYKYGFGALVAFLGTAFISCSDFKPTGYEPVPDLPTVSNLKAEIVRHDINLSWQLPTSKDITDVQVVLNGRSSNPVKLGPGATSYTVVGQPMGEEAYYTVKVCYGDRYMSEGISTTATLPVETLTGASNPSASVAGRTVTISWNYPSAEGITGARVYRDGNSAGAVTVDANVNSCTFKSQPMDQELVYTIEVMYDQYYASTPVNVKTTVPYITPKMAYLLTVDNFRDLADDDEKAAARWFSQQENAEFVTVDQLANLDVDIYPVVWVEIDRIGLAPGWENLPTEFSSEESIAALKAYSANGGNLYLSNMATQLTVPLGIVPENMGPTVFGSGDGGEGGDVWVINPHLGWDFRPGGERPGFEGQEYYDRAEHAIFAGLTLEDPNNYGYSTLPLIGPGHREDHNCMWDCNIYGRGQYPDVIANFEATTGSIVLATWGHVRDHCVAGLVDFYATAEHGRCVAMGLAAYEWNQNSSMNPYQGNIEKLTENILNYLK